MQLVLVKSSSNRFPTVIFQYIYVTGLISYCTLMILNTSVIQFGVVPTQYIDNGENVVVIFVESCVRSLDHINHRSSSP